MIRYFFTALLLLASCSADYSTKTFRHTVSFFNAGDGIDASTSLQAFSGESALNIKLITDSIFEMNGSNDSATVNFLIHNLKLKFGKVPADFINTDSDFEIGYNQVTTKTPNEWPLRNMNDFAVLQISYKGAHYVQAMDFNNNQLGIYVEREK